MLLVYKKMLTLTGCRECQRKLNGMDVMYRGVVFLTAVYFVHQFYYSVKRFQVNQWNARKSQISYKALVENMNLTEVQTLADGITVVTAFFEIDNLDKSASMWSKRNLQTYVEWMGFFQYMNNPLIFFTDSPAFAQRIRHMRIGMAETKIFEIDRNTLYSFRLSKRISEIFSRPGYPYHSPNTVNSNYSCIMHAKFELMTKVLNEKLCSTKYLAWLDFGYFRHEIHDSRIFSLQVPMNFDDNKISFTEYSSNVRSDTPASIVSENKVWVTGGLFIARPEVMKVFSEDYAKSVETLIGMNWMSTDQQVIYCMYTVGFPVKPRVEIHVHTVYDENWFHLGDISRDIGAASLRKHIPVLDYFFRTM